ncbi:MOSC domain-containing protein YiiM [Pasteurella langaaensis DSM 22999]|uniref:MOSC domain-containing protein YiiM n=1 Tax=Alitibacter langaaensis DSM 22999 TaxID=1122935 RepID=A0A2U0TH02_9PAST|nr:MOSC domain-containing protein [Pasteurella langaaensis]PVX42867.1 MOSC domain-containing protein YiiM [Pasteurella langaaensis DSM 22999]
MAEVLAVKTAMIEPLVSANGAVINTAVRKKAVPNLVVSQLGAVGDDVGNKKHHGGMDKALFFNGQKTLEKLTALLGLDYDYLQDSRFGENVVVSSLDEESVCIGDQFQIGEVLIEVSQPRKPCNTLLQSTGVAETRKVMVEQNLVGWYVRVLQTGEIHVGDRLTLVQRPYADLTVANVHCLLSQPAKNLDKTKLDQALNCPALAEAYKSTLRKQAEKLAQSSSESAFFNTPEF